MSAAACYAFFSVGGRLLQHVDRTLCCSHGLCTVDSSMRAFCGPAAPLHFARHNGLVKLLPASEGVGVKGHPHEGRRGCHLLTLLAAGAARKSSRACRRACKTEYVRFASEGVLAFEEGPEEHDQFELQDEEKRRLDVLLSEKYEQSRSYFGALIRQGAVHVNGRARKKSFREFHPGDVVDVRFLLDERTLPMKPEPMDLDILFEDAHILIVNKPAGLVVHPAPGHWTGTLVNAVLHHLGFRSSESGLPAAPPGPAAQFRPGIVHRLDVGTSGVIAVAKTAQAFAVLSQAFSRREVQKTYLVISVGGRKYFFGHSRGGGHFVDIPIGRSKKDRRRMAAVSEDCGGRSSVSLVRGLARDNRDLILLEVRPRTGRTHQIRVHLAEEHSPIIGDACYGWEHLNRRYAGLATRPMLHAFRLAFAHPVTGQQMEFEAGVPEDMQKLISRMEPEPSESVFVQSLYENLAG